MIRGLGWGQIRYRAGSESGRNAGPLLARYDPGKASFSRPERAGPVRVSPAGGAPVTVSDVADASSVSGNFGHTCALLTGGGLP